MEKHVPWREKMQDLFQSCQIELKKTTDIGKKMLTASKTNSCLHDAHEEIGTLVVKAIRRGDLTWNHPRVKELLEIIDNCEKDLEIIETEVQNIKVAQTPEEK